jgi:hypothetical protein
MAISRRRPQPGLVHHSDHGSQYVSLVFGEHVREAAIDVSMGSKGSALDNAVVESFFSTLKRELVGRRSWPVKSEARLLYSSGSRSSITARGSTRRPLCVPRRSSKDPPSQRRKQNLCTSQEVSTETGQVQSDRELMQLLSCPVGFASTQVWSFVVSSRLMRIRLAQAACLSAVISS